MGRWVRFIFHLERTSHIHHFRIPVGILDGLERIWTFLAGPYQHLNDHLKHQNVQYILQCNTVTTVLSKPVHIISFHLKIPLRLFVH